MENFALSLLIKNFKSKTEKLARHCRIHFDEFKKNPSKLLKKFLVTHCVMSLWTIWRLHLMFRDKRV